MKAQRIIGLHNSWHSETDYNQ